MATPQTTIVDLARLSLAHGQGARLEPPAWLEPLELGGQTYVPPGERLEATLDISRPSNGYAFRLRFPLHVEGPCMRCLEDAAVESEVDAREVDQADTEDEELRSPYVVDDELDLGRWAHDAAILALPTQILCRPDCAGLCPVCGESLNDADPEAHRHDPGGDPRWAKLNELNWSSIPRLMAVPKKRTSRTRRDKRRANHKAGKARLNECPRCHSPRLPHRVCPTCGTYKGREVIEHSIVDPTAPAPDTE